MKMQRYACLDKTCDVFVKFRHERRSFKKYNEAQTTLISQICIVTTCVQYLSISVLVKPPTGLLIFGELLLIFRSSIH